MQNTVKKTSVLKALAFSLVPVLAIGIVVEAAARFIENHRPPYWRNMSRLTDPAYTSKPWFSEAFLAASFTQPGGWTTPAGTTMILPKDCQNPYFTVVRGVRKTTGFQWNVGDPPPIKLLLLGASNVYCSEVPDDLTWASLLQSQLAQHESTRGVRAFNYGTTSAKTSQMLERLRYEIEQGNVPDVCVLYTGGNDVIQDVYNNDPDAVIFQTELSHQPAWYIRLASRSAVFRLMLARAQQHQPPPPHVNDTRAVEQLAVKAADEFAKNIRQTQDLCRRYNVRLVVLLHPTVYSIGRPLNDHEAAAIEHSRPGLKQCFDVTYPLFKEKIASLRREGIDAYDLTDIFDANDKPIFLDGFHVESDGNAIVAQAVFQRLSGVVDSSLAKGH